MCQTLGIVEIVGLDRTFTKPLDGMAAALRFNVGVRLNPLFRVAHIGKCKSESDGMSFLTDRKGHSDHATRWPPKIQKPHPGREASRCVRMFKGEPLLGDSALHNLSMIAAAFINSLTAASIFVVFIGHL